MMAGRSMNKKGRNKYPTFVMLRHDVMDSAAYRSLSPVARCIHAEIRRRFNGHNTGDIPLSCREAAEYCRVWPNTAAAGFDQLIDRGFIKVGEEAGFNQKSGRRSRRWILTEEGYMNQPPTNDWRSWKPA